MINPVKIHRIPKQSHKESALSACISSWCPHSLIMSFLLLKPVISWISVKYHTIRDFCLVVGLMNYNSVNCNTWYQAFSLLLTTALEEGCHGVLSLLSWCDWNSYGVISSGSGMLTDISTRLQIFPAFLNPMWAPICWMPWYIFWSKFCWTILSSLA